MAIVSGIREKVHLPIYDCLKVDGGEQLKDVSKSSTLTFFVDVQNKTKLLTNLQSASLLPHYNTFEARAMRVVVSDLPPEFSDEAEVTIEELEVFNNATPPVLQNVTATVTTDLATAMDLLEQARESEDGEVYAEEEELDIELSDATAIGARSVPIGVGDLEAAIEDMDEAPPREQMRPGNGSGSILSKIIYNTVTTLYVGEKVMVEAPTWLFPAGAGPYSERGTFATHGEPNPLATFRFAEPIFIDKQQNFRVEIEIPESETVKEIQSIYGPLFIWVILDGYMNRGVQ